MNGRMLHVIIIVYVIPGTYMGETEVDQGLNFVEPQTESLDVKLLANT